jgi:uncharacterized protein YjbJ (UPF0337 family)
MRTHGKAARGADRLKGRAKVAVGKATGAKRLQTKGRNDQVKADVMRTIQKVKDAFKR